MCSWDWSTSVADEVAQRLPMLRWVSVLISGWKDGEPSVFMLLQTINDINMLHYETTEDKMIATAQEISYSSLYCIGAERRAALALTLALVNVSQPELKIVQSRKEDGEWILESVEMALKVPPLRYLHSLKRTNLKGT